MKIMKDAAGSGIRLYDCADLELLILVGWDRSFIIIDLFVRDDALTS